MVFPTKTTKETLARMLMNSGSAEVKIRKKISPPRMALFPKDHEDTIIRMFKSNTYEMTLNEVNQKIGNNEFFVDGNDLEIYQSVKK